MQPEDAKVRSFRVTDETVEKLKSIAKDMGGSQAAALARLVSMYESASAASTVPEDEPAITEFTRIQNMLTRAYLDAMEKKNEAYKVAEKEMDSVMRSKDRRITELEKKADAEAKKAADFKERYDKALSEALAMGEKASGREKEISRLEGIVKDKDRIISILTEENKRLEDEAAGAARLEEKLREAEERLEAVQKELEEAKREAEAVSLRMEKKEIEHEKMLLALERKLQEKNALKEGQDA